MESDADPMNLRSEAGVWECFIAGVANGALYKYRIESRFSNYRADKADPYGFAAEIRPQTASKVWDLAGYEWRDGEWILRRQAATFTGLLISIYEVHLGSWRRVAGGRNGGSSYRELAQQLVDYVHDMGFTHVEFLPLTRASVRRILGLSDHRLLRADQPLRHAG